MTTIEEIGARLFALRDRDPSWKVPGCSAWFFEPVAPLEAVERWERRRGVSLPGDYRAFITTVASGGPGPGIGLVPFGHRPLGRTHLGRAITLSDRGCDMLDRLLVDGPHAGAIVRSAERKVELLDGAASFLEWYCAWLAAGERALA